MEKETKEAVIAWVKVNGLESMFMQSFPPNGWQWRYNNTQKVFFLETFDGNETVTKKDVTA